MTQHWDPVRYADDVGFVARLGEPLIAMLAPQPHERILDLGCGDGVLTEKIAAIGCDVVGVDSSPEQIAAAREKGLAAQVVDGHELPFKAEFDAVISNAALHWMRRPDEVIGGVARALKAHGRFIGEFGGAGNVASIVTGLEPLLRRHGIAIAQVNPWYFPAKDEYVARLVRHGFKVEQAELFERPTPLDTDIVAWLRMFTQSFVAPLTADAREQIWLELREGLQPQLCNDDGRWTVDYVRLRFVAHRA